MGVPLPGSEATARPVPPPAPRPAASIVLISALWILVGAVVVQAMLAGLFLSGISAARLAHLLVGWVLPYAAIGLAAIAAAGHVRRTCAPWLAIAIYPVPVLLWIQEVLGHVPAAITTAVHVPFGVLLTVYPAVLATRATALRKAR